jgi:hypothetical protein
MTPKMLAPYGLNLYFKIIFHGLCAKEIWIFFNPHVHLSNTITKHLSWNTLSPKYDKRDIKVAKFSNLKIKNETKNKSLSI